MGLLRHEQLERVTLVAEQRGRVAAAAHLLRYGDGAEVGGVLPRCWGDPVAAALPDAPFWADASAADYAVAVAAVTFLTRSGASRLYVDCALLAQGVYGLPRSGPMCTPFSTGPDSTPVTDRDRVPRRRASASQESRRPSPGLSLTRTLGSNGTRFSALLDGDVVGYVEVEGRNGDAGCAVQHDGWADIGNLHVQEPHRRRRIR
jgi:hypothetical protein